MAFHVLLPVKTEGVPDRVTDLAGSICHADPDLAVYLFDDLLLETTVAFEAMLESYQVSAMGIVLLNLLE